MVKKIVVTSLGSACVKVDGREILADAHKLTKPWQLFFYLVQHNGTVVSSEELLRVLWANEELTDAANVLKNTVYGLRKEFPDSQSTSDSPIAFRSGGYCLNQHIRFVIDTEHFTEVCAKAERSAARDTYEENLRTACEAYTGDYLPMLDDENWALQIANSYRKRYMQIANALCTQLEKQNNWAALLALTTQITLTDPYDEPATLHLFRALQGLQMYRAIAVTYSKTARFFKEEQNLLLCDEIEQIHNEAQEHLNRIEQDILTVQDDLNDISRAQAGFEGAFYCNYETFRRMYLLLARTAKRSGDVVMLLLVTIQDNKGRMPVMPQLTPAMDQLHAIIASCMRRSDVFCRYTKSQYIALLPINGKDSAGLVVERMHEQFAQANGRLQLNCRMVEMHEVETEVLPISNEE